MFLKCGPGAREVLARLGIDVDAFLATDQDTTIGFDIRFTWRGYKCSIYKNVGSIQHPDQFVGATFVVE